MESVVTPRSHRLLLSGFAVAATCACVAMLVDRADRDWARPPQVPYVDEIDDHWLYRMFDAMSTRDPHLGIWGWAAHEWVYSGLLPATRESSTEFAFRNWGPNGYYRERYLAALRARPPEFFVEAVGPGQFLFNERTTYGVGSLPGLGEFVSGGYQRLMDDGDTDVYMRKDVFAACCAFPATSWRGTDGMALPTGSTRVSPLLSDQQWTEAQLGTPGGTLTMTLTDASRITRVLVPYVSIGNPLGASIRVTGGAAADGQATTCDATLHASKSGHFDLCILDIAPSAQATLTVMDAPRLPEGSLIIGRPILIHDPSRAGGPSP